MRFRPGAAVLAMAVLAAACSGGSPSARPTITTESASPATPSPTPTASPTASPAPSCAESVFDSMTEAQRVGQLLMVGLQDDALGQSEAAAIVQHHLGNVSFIVTTHVGVVGIRSVTGAVQALSSPAATDGVRFFVAANQEGGQIQALQGPGFDRIPTAVAQGQIDPEGLQSDATGWARQLKAAGVNFNFAPVMDVVPAGTEDQNQPIGVLQREYGTDPAAVAAHGVAFLKGMQRGRVATSAKHFPGLGRVLGNTDFTANVIDKVTTADDPYLQSFQAAVDAKVPFVMVALATYTKIDPHHLAVFSPTVMQLLRDGMGFGGVIVSDDIGEAEAIRDIPPGQRAIEFLSAGGDLIVSKTVEPAVEMASAILGRMASDPAFGDRVQDAVHRVLEAKAAFGLLPCP